MVDPLNIVDEETLSRMDVPELEGLTWSGRTIGGIPAPSELMSESDRRAVSQEETGTDFLPGLEDLIRHPDGGSDRLDPLKWLLRQESGELGEVRAEGARTMYWPAGYEPSVEDARQMEAMGFLRESVDPLTGKPGRPYYPVDKDIIDKVISTPWDKTKAVLWGVPVGSVFGVPITAMALDAVAMEMGTGTRLGIEQTYRSITDREDFRDALAEKAKSRNMSWDQLMLPQNAYLRKEVLDENYKMPWGAAGAMEGPGYMAVPLTAGEALILKGGFSVFKGGYGLTRAAYKFASPSATLRGLARHIPPVPRFINKLSEKVYETRSRNLNVHEVTDPEARMAVLEEGGRPDLDMIREFEIWSTDGEPLLYVTAQRTFATGDKPYKEGAFYAIEVQGLSTKKRTGGDFVEGAGMSGVDISQRRGSQLEPEGFFDDSRVRDFSRREVLEIAEAVGEMLGATELHGIRFAEEIPVAAAKTALDARAIGSAVPEAVEATVVGMGKGARFQKMTMEYLRKALNRSEPVDAHTSDVVSQGRIKLFDDAYNPVVEGIEGLADGALRWNDLSFWYRMVDDVDIRGIRNDLDHSGRKVLSDVFKRLENLGLVGEVRPGVYRRLVENGSVKANEILGELSRFHRGVVSGGSTNVAKWITDLGSFQAAFGRVKTVENKVLRGFLTGLGINPSVGALTPLEQMVIAYARQTNVSEELVEVAIQAAYDSHRTRWQPFGKGPGFSFGNSPIKMDTDGMIDLSKGVTQFHADYEVVRGLESSRGKVHWNDVFADPDSFGSAFAEGTPARRLIDEYQEMIREIEELRLSYGLPERTSRLKGLVYIPRIGYGSATRGDFIRPVSAYEARIWDTATEGAVEGAVRYEADPRAVLELHLRASYHDILMKQMEDFVLRSDFGGGVLGITPDAVLRDVVPDVMSRLKQRYAIFKSMEDDLIKMRVRNVSRAKLLGDMSPEVQNAAKMIAEQVKRVRKARELFDVTKNERDAALLNIKREGKARAALFSGDEKGMVQFSEFMGIFMRKGDPKILTDGIEDLLGPAHPWLRVANKLAGTIKYTSATLDLAGPFTHGLMMLPTNPIRWAKAAWHSTWALMDPTVQSHFIRDNIDVIRRMARAGVPIGDVEYFQAAKPGGGIAWGAPLSKVKAGPVNGEFLRSLANGLIGNTLGRFQAAYNADVLIMRTELWKAMEPYFYNERRRGGDAELASAVANTTGGIDIKALGAGPNHRAIEGMMIAFAPRLMRSVATIFADAFRAIPTETGFRLGFKEEGATAKQMQALKSLTSVVTFMHGFAGSAWIANEYSKKLQNPKGHTINWEKGYTELFNPLSGRRYMSIEVDGEWYGIGGQTRGMLQLLTGMFMAMNPLDESDKSFVSWDSQKNPWLQRLVTLGAPGLDASQAILEAATGADLVPGEEIDSPIDVIRHVSSNALMFAIQGKLEGDNLWGVMGSSIGFNTKPSTPFENGMNLRRDVFENMSLAEKAEFADKDGNYLRTWPGTTHGDAWENMDLRLKEYIDAQDENIGVFLEEHRKRRLEAGDEDQKYFSLRDEIIGERDSALEGVEEKYGVGEEYRLRMSSIYADTKSRLRQLDLDFDEVVGGLEVSDRKSEAEYNKAELKFWDAMGELDADGKSVFIDPDTKEYNYSLDRQVRKRLEADPLVGPYLDQIDERLRSMHPLGVRDFWEDMERMKDYFVMGETVAQEMGLRSEYMVWLGQGKDNRRALEGRDMALAALVRPGGNIDQVKQKMRRGADEARGWSADDALLLESALLKWEYVEKAQNPRLRYLWTKMLVDQGNWVHKREAIDQYVEDAIAEQRGALEPAAR